MPKFILVEEIKGELFFFTFFISYLFIFLHVPSVHLTCKTGNIIQQFDEMVQKISNAYEPCTSPISCTRSEMSKSSTKLEI